MCTSMPARVVRVSDDGTVAVADVDGTERRVDLTVLTFDGRTARPGDWLLVHTGFAVDVLAPDDAAELLALHRSIHSVQSGEERA